ncbi:flagellar hook-basal body complex protein FliE [Terrarubrum flagellatum]|uniref:flagellar hook-basal body complex protein FliE n=1 Tax=Terrirubrum flagellatum TaxID=2895980 RepID=UPI00314546A0
MVSSVFAANAYGNAASALTRASQSTPSGGGFGEMVQNALRGAMEAGAKADAQSVQAAQGKGNLIDVVTAVNESEAAIETLVAVRDRVISAYEDIMRMQI